MLQPSETAVTPLGPPVREPSQWYVTNGRKVVGPVDTRLLLRGINVGRVDRERFVAQFSWSNWRQQNHVREIRSLRRWQHSQKVAPGIEPVKQALRPPRFDAAPLQHAEGEEKLLSRALELAISWTRANVGVIHQPKAPHVGLVTSFVFGPGMRLNLGEVVPWHDEARAVASAERARLGDPANDGWARASARRLSNRLHRQVSGVALVPICIGGARGFLELGRYDHGFRQGDAAVLETLSRSLAQRLTR